MENKQVDLTQHIECPVCGKEIIRWETICPFCGQKIGDPDTENLVLEENGEFDPVYRADSR